MILLALSAIVTLTLRIIYYDLSNNEKIDYIIIKLFNNVKSIKYYFPLKHFEGEDMRIRKLKRIANFFLYLFLITFLLVLVYSFLLFINA